MVYFFHVIREHNKQVEHLSKEATRLYVEVLRIKAGLLSLSSKDKRGIIVFSPHALL